MPTFPVMPGVPAAGHVTGGGAWHPGRAEGCGKCTPSQTPRDRQRAAERDARRRGARRG